MSIQEKIDRVYELTASLRVKAETPEDYWFSSEARMRQEIYEDAETRALKLGSKLINTKNGWKHYTPRSFEAIQKKKAERKKAFDENIRVFPWFYRTRFHNDYGTFSCENCKDKFHHSPARLMKGMATIHECVCGHCANSISGQDFYD